MGMLFPRKGFLDSSAGKDSTCNAGDLSSIPQSGRSAGERTGYPLQYSWASLVAQLVKNLPAMWETWVRYLGWEDPLEKGKGTHSSILAKRIPWPIVHGVTKSRMTERFSLPPDILHPSNTVHSCHSIPFLLSFSSKHLPLPDIPLYNHLPSLKHKLLKESNFCFVHRYIPCQWTNSKKHHQCG